jgi:hypothetical protein
MEKEKQALIKTAQELYGEIKPCGYHHSLCECFTFDDDDLLLWFNDITNSTKILRKSTKTKS